MPRYDYRCTQCANDFEIVRPLGETADVTCPQCDSPSRRVFSPVGVVFKGSGFHNTDYRTSSRDAAPEKTSDTAPAPACGSDCASCPASGS